MARVTLGVESLHVELIRTRITCHTEDVLLCRAAPDSWDRASAELSWAVWASEPQLSQTRSGAATSRVRRHQHQAGRPAPHTPREIRGRRRERGTGTSLMMWRDNTNHLYPATIQIISDIRRIIGSVSGFWQQPSVHIWANRNHLYRNQILCCIKISICN